AVCHICLEDRYSTALRANMSGEQAARSGQNYPLLQAVLRGGLPTSCQPQPGSCHARNINHLPRIAYILPPVASMAGTQLSLLLSCPSAITQRPRIAGDVRRRLLVSPVRRLVAAGRFE